MELTVLSPLSITLMTNSLLLPAATACENVALVRALDEKFTVTAPATGIGEYVVADWVLDQPVSFGIAALSRALTLNEYRVLGVRPEATYIGLACQLLLLLASVVHSK
jgi:hypothetical protein